MVAADSFNADFYITAATVIPVLFLAVTLQSEDWFRWLLFFKCRQVLARRAMRRGTELTRPQRAWLNGWNLINWASGLFEAAGVVGELSAFVAIVNRHATPHEHFYVFGSVVALTAATLLMLAGRYAAKVGDLYVELAKEEDGKGEPDPPAT